MLKINPVHYELTEIIDSLKLEDLKNFSDAYSYGTKPGDGIFVIKENNGIIEIDLIDAEIFSSHGFIVEDIAAVFRRLVSRFPDIELSGDYEVAMKYSDEIVELTSNADTKGVQVRYLVCCECCGKKAEHEDFLLASEGISSGICSFRCAFRYVFNVDEDGEGGYDEFNSLEDFDEGWESWFWDKFISESDDLLTEDNAEAILELLEENCDNEDAIDCVQGWLDNNL